MLQADLIQRLIELQTPAQDRVFHEVVPQDTDLPFIASSRISGSQPLTLDGRRLAARATVRLAIFGEKGEQTEAIEVAIRNALNGFRGQLWRGAAPGVPLPPDPQPRTIVHALRVEASAESVGFADGDKVIKGTGLDLVFTYSEES